MLGVLCYGKMERRIIVFSSMTDVSSVWVSDVMVNICSVRESLSFRDENIRYIRRYISDISDIGDVRHDIGDISLIYRGNIKSVAHAHISLIFR